MRKNNKAFVLLIALITFISIGYASLSSNLKIDGTGIVQKQSWDIHFANVKVTSDSVPANKPQIINDTIVNYSVRLAKPGDFYEFTVDVVNAGSIDAVISKVIKDELNDEQKKYLSYNVLYIDDNEIKIGDELLKNTGKTIKVRLEFLRDIDASVLPTNEVSFDMSLEMKYIQKGMEDNTNDWNNDNILKVLAIGNSFTNDTMEYVYQVANNLGIKNMELAYLYASGASLQTHLTNVQADNAAYDYYTNNNGKWNITNNYKISDAVSYNNWDYIMFQQQSTLAATPNSYSTLNDLLPIVKSYVNEESNPKYVWNLTWATRDVDNQVLEFKAIVAAVQSQIVPNSNISVIIPTGTAIQNARTIYGNTLNKDALHLNVIDGRYIASVAFVKALLGLDISNLTYVVPGGREDILASAIASANAAYENPYQIANLGPYYENESEKVNSMYVECPVAREGYKCLNLEYTSGFWNSNTGNTTKVTSSVKYMSSQIVEKKYIPNGSIVKIASGWLYRPEGWQALSTVNPNRPVSVSYVVSTNGEKLVDDTWHSDFNYRAFVLSKSSEDISSYSQDELKEILQVYVPISEIEKLKE